MQLTMKPHRRQRLLLVLLLVFASLTATGLALLALQQNINLFFSPQQVTGGHAPVGTRIRVGGMVLEDSVRRARDSLDVSFVLSDMQDASFTVHYTGILPDLFREGQGIVATGQLSGDGDFFASEVLAKHDENYMPPEVGRMLADTADAGGSAP